MPYIDTHSHIAPDIDFDAIIESVNSCDVSQIAIMPRGGSEESEVVELHHKYPDRIIPFYGGADIQNIMMEGSIRASHDGVVKFFWGYRREWWDLYIDEVLEYIERELASAPYRGIGELRLRHYGHGPQMPEKEHDYFFPPNSPFLFRLVDLAARLRIPVAIHMEAESVGELIKFLGKPAEHDTVTPFEELLAHNRNATIILCHLGRASPKVLDRMLATHPNLYTDISDVQPRGRHAAGISQTSLAVFAEYTLKNSIIDAQGVLNEDWKNFLLRYSERIMMGTDACSAKCYGAMYSALVSQLKDVLSQLTPAAAQLIGYSNARKIFGV